MPAKRKTVKKPLSSHKKAQRQHPKHFIKVYWPYIPILAVVVFGMLFSNVNPRVRDTNPATLAYATEMSRSGLLNRTNQERTSRGLAALKLNSKLNSSALAKANDMVAKNYWSHNSPNGDEPWVFFDAAGYNYQKAGENLAYGFSTSSATVTGWMNSPSHKANILDSGYTEVGFGFANSTNFVGTGQETIVVAHYARPTTSSSSGSTAQKKSAPPAQTKAAEDTKPTAAEETKKSEEPKKEEENTKEDTVVPSEKITSNEPITSDNPVPDEREQTSITLLQQLTGGKAPWSALALSGITFAIVVVWLMKHAVLVKRFALQGEHFVAHHPVLDLIVVSIAAAAVYLSQSSGVVL